MKKHLLFAILLIASCSLSAQTVITGWNFPVNGGPDSLNANLGLSGNKSYDIRYEGTDTTYSTIYFAEGVTDYAAAAKGWDNGANAKLWSIKFKANGYSNFKVSSKQYSTADGPRDFKLQWKISGGTFQDVPSGTVVVSTNWTNGVVDSLPLPITGQGTSSVYINWIMASDTSVNGGTVTSTGETRIDDILVTATGPTGVGEILFSNRINLGPNPSNGHFNVNSMVSMDELRISDMTGRTVMSKTNAGTSVVVDLPGLAKGTYLLSVKFEDQSAWFTKKIMIN
ncbi:MAG: T9SS type A sorting domain-containing protein [Bacteroidota bacterium]|nr:T9SS type A sorting domain-containing protein [Bacteroidota bacterium]